MNAHDKDPPWKTAARRADAAAIGVMVVAETLTQPSSSIDDTITERRQAHGDFSEDAALAQAFKDLGHGAPNWSALSAIQREAFEQSMTKWARILVGDPNWPDHWRDLQGYPRLVETRL